MPKKGYSRNTLLGRVSHYDSTGKKTGESRRGILDNEWIHYDEKGKRVAVTRNSIFGGTYTTDTHGKRIGYSRDNLWGGTNYYDTHGHLVGCECQRKFEPSANQYLSHLCERILEPPTPKVTANT